MSYMDIDLEKKLMLTLAKIVGEAIAILGMRGSGKTNTTAVLIEEIISRIPLTIIDPEGEYYGLREKYDVIVAGKSPRVDLQVKPAQAAALAEFSLRQRVSIILDLSDFSPDQAQEFVLSYLTRLWETASELRRPYYVVIDEAHEFAEQGGASETKDMIVRFAKRGRKRGIGLIVISQRSQAVDKNLLTQMTKMFLHRVSHASDMSLYKKLIPGMKGVEIEAAVRGLKPGQAIFSDSDQSEIVSIRQRHTFHAGATPTLDAVETAPEFKSTDSVLLDQLKRALEIAPSTSKTHDPVPELQTQIEALKAQIDALNVEIKHKDERIETLSKLTVSLPDPAPIQQMQVQQIAAGEIVAKSVNGHAPVAVIDEQPESDEVKSTKQRQRDVYSQRRKFEDLLTRLKRLPKWQVKMLKFLIDNSDKQYTIRKLAWGVDVALSTIYANAPIKLIDEGLILREGSGMEGFIYKSNAHVYVAREFAALDAAELLDELRLLA